MRMDGVSRRIFSAKHYYVKAAERGHADAKKKLVEISNTLNINVRNIKDRIKDLRQAFDEVFGRIIKATLE